nr:hypothetical protein [Tanacetum cinerariifolium]
MIASSKDECPRPSKCPISWTATDSRSIADEDEDVVMPFISHVSSMSRCSRPRGGANACASVPDNNGNKFFATRFLPEVFMKAVSEHSVRE